ncbi:hypothetical protein D3C86_1462350 [compost metagenome]
MGDDLGSRREGQPVAQGLRDREQVEAHTAFLGAEVAIQFVATLAGTQEVVVVDHDVADASVRQRRDHGGFPDPLGQPGALRRHAGPGRQLGVEGGQLADPVARRDGGEDRFAIAGAEQLDLAALDHRGEQRHVGRKALAQPVEQPAGNMHRETEAGIVEQGLQERLVAAQMRLFDDLREIADGLVGMHAEQQGDGVGHGPPSGASGISGATARRIVPALSDAPPWLIGCSRLAGTGSSSRR